LYQKGELIEAHRLLEPTLRGPKGSAQDFSHVVEAALLLEHGRPLEALKILRPLQGKIIDPVERFLATDQLVRAALAAGLHSEALTYMVDWIEQATGRDRTRVTDAIELRLAQIPDAALERALDDLDPQTAREGYELVHRQWLFNTLSVHLARRAQGTRNAELAARVLERDPSLALDPKATELVRLATGGDPPATIAGRTLGLLLSRGDEQARRRSTQLAGGIADVLGYTGATAGGLQLVFEQDAPDAVAALTRLSAQGAALLVAGVDAGQAELAARYAELTHSPLLLINEVEGASPYVFSVGVGLEHQERMLWEALRIRGASPVRSYGTELDQCSPNRDFTATLAGLLNDGVRGVAFLGDAACAQQLLASAPAGARLEVGLGLEAAPLLDSGKLDTGSGLPLRLCAGRFPLAQQDTTWFAALGHDVASIAVDVLSTLPEVRLDEPDEVARYHERVRRALTEYQSDALWTASKARFDARGRLERELTTCQGSKQGDSSR
jgi:hypothetical protein